MRGTFFVLTLSFLGLTGMAPAQDIVQATLQKADAALANRNFEQSLLDYEVVLKEYEKQNNQKGIAEICYKMGYAHRKLGEFEKADKFLTRALKLHQELGDTNAAALDLTEYATSRERVGSYDEALALSEKALALHRASGNKDAVARTLDNIANAYYRLGQYDKSKDYFLQGLRAGEEGGNKETLIYLWQNYGTVFLALADYDKALECYEKARHFVEEIGDPRLLGTIEGNEALVFTDLGELEKARDSYKRLLVLFEKTGQKQYLANTEFNLGALDIGLGNYGEAEQLLLKANQLATEIKDQGLSADVLSTLGQLHTSLRNYDQARDYLTQSCQLSQATGERHSTARSYEFLGNVAFFQGQYKAALDEYQKELGLATELGDTYQIAGANEGIALAHGGLGDHRRELEYHKKALSLRESIGDRNGIAASNMEIGSAYYSIGRMAEADVSLEKAIDLLRTVGNQEFLWQSLYKRALVFRDTGRTPDSIRLMKQAVDVIENLRGTAELAEQKWSFLEDKVRVYEDLIAMLMKTQDVEGAFEFVERSRARAFLDLLAEARIDPDRALNSSQYTLKRRLLAKLLSLNSKIQEEFEENRPDEAAIAGLKQEQRKLDGEYERLMVELRAENPRYEDLQRPVPLSIRQAQAMLDANTAIAEFFVGRNQSLVFLISSDTWKSFLLPGDDTLGAQVLSLLESIRTSRPPHLTDASFQRFIQTASGLYEGTLKPAETLLRGKSRIILVPDGPLNYLPFEALLSTGARRDADFSRLPYLAVKYDLQYVPSISVLSALARDTTRAQPRDLIAFADPAVETEKNNPSSASGAIFREWSSALERLPYAQAEVAGISSLYPVKSVAVFTDENASESRVKHSPLYEYRIVHFASHGLIDEERPQFSSLVLAPGDSQEDGFLTMREVFDLKLNSDLVVLSACKSGLGKRIRGEGVAGLSMAFLTAGTSNVVVSLWDVSDRSTAEFMTTFYKNMRKPHSTKAGSLRAARLQMIRGEKFAHPYYWAPFILIGAN